MQDAHKVVIQNNFAAPVAGPIGSLWSASRTDQVACLSQLCYGDQMSNGNYVNQVSDASQWQLYFVAPRLCPASLS